MCGLVYIFMCVCVFGFTILVGPRSPHKDSKTRNISPVPSSKKAILGLGIRIRVRVRDLWLKLGLRLGSGLGFGLQLGKIGLSMGNTRIRNKRPTNNNHFP